MALPDTLERIGIVVGSVFLLSLPTSAFFSLLYGIGEGPQFLPYLWLLPGIIVGVLAATDRLPVTYHQIWKFSLASYFLASVYGLLPVSGANRVLAVGWWLGAVAVGAAVARVRFRRLRSTEASSSARNS